MSAQSIASRIGAHVRAILTNPTTEMRNAFRALPAQHRWLLYALLDSNTGGRDSTARLQHRYEALCPVALAGPFRRTFDELTEAFLRQGEFSIDWVHPTCRDLTVSELADSHQDRRHFLAHCSVEGLSAGLGIATGASGGVDLPLVTSEGDWTLVRSRAGHLEPWGVLNLIVGVHAGWSYRHSEKPESHPPQLLEIGKQTLLRVSRVMVEGHYLTERNISILLRAKKAFHPALTLDIGRFLVRLVDGAAGILESEDFLDAVESVKDCFDMCASLSQQEPQLFRELFHGPVFSSLESSCTAAVGHMRSQEGEDLTDEDALELDDLEARSRRYDRLIDAVQGLREELSEINNSESALELLNDAAQGMKDNLDAEIRRRKPPRIVPTRTLARWQSYASRSRADDKRIRKIFRDL